MVVLRLIACVLLGQPSNAKHLLRGSADTSQHIYLIRHGDKYASYPPCPGVGGIDKDGQPCFDEALFGKRYHDNSPLTACGIKQASYIAEHLKTRGHIANIVVSPYTRTLQTSLPLAKSLGLKLKVEHLLSEGIQQERVRDPNGNDPSPTSSQLEECNALRDESYDSQPIHTPEDQSSYLTRVIVAAAKLKERFPPTTGNLALVTHGTTLFSIAYGLCYGQHSSDEEVKAFVSNQAAIGPAGIIEVELAADGSCKKISQTNNVADSVACGKTAPYKCNFNDHPSWYWPTSLGLKPGFCPNSP